MPNKANIFVGAVDVYIAERSNEANPVSHDPFPGTAWKEVGYMKQGTIKLSGEAFEIDLHDGQKMQTSVAQKFETMGLETDDTKLGVLEGFINSKCDVIFKPTSASNTRAWKLLGVNVSVAIEGTLAHNDALGVKISGQAIGLVPTDIVSEITLS